MFYFLALNQVSFAGIALISADNIALVQLLENVLKNGKTKFFLASLHYFAFKGYKLPLSFWFAKDRGGIRVT